MMLSILLFVGTLLISLAAMAKLNGASDQLNKILADNRGPIRRFTESGLPGFEFNSWFAILAPAGTPKDIAARLSAEVGKALADPEVRDKLNAQGLTPRGSTPEELGAMTKSQLERYGKLFKLAGIQAE